MILQSLVQHYERLAESGRVSEPGWCQARVSYALMLRADGTLSGIMPMKHSEQRGKKLLEVPSSLCVPEMVSRSSGISANFLCDNSRYLLGIDQDGAGERNADCFAAAKERHCKLLEEIHTPCAEAVKSFFKSWEPSKAGNCRELAEVWDDLMTGNLVFWADGQFVHDDHLIREAWERARQNAGDEQEGICLVTGEKSEIARIHGSIKGVMGAQSSGAALVSFNAPAFESYGKEQSYNAPVGKYAVFAYTTALNYLISQKKYVQQLGDTTVVYWSEDAGTECQDLFLAASEPTKDNQELLEGVFGNLARGWAVDTDAVSANINLEQKFYILGISPNAARLSVRFFYVDSFGSILRHLKEHYDRMEIIRPAYDGLRYLGIWRMLQETVNLKSRDRSPQPGMAGRVFAAILSGGRYPESLYSAVLQRIRAEQDDENTHIRKITRGRAAIIKAYLIRNRAELVEKGDDFVALNETCDNVAYVLGREFAVLEAIQEEANPGINATIKDRYFNSACATPGVIFPVLLKLKNSHIRKLETGSMIHFEKLLTELQGKLSAESLPKRLNLEEQGVFILGYYHQVQKRFTKKEEN